MKMELTEKGKIYLSLFIILAICIFGYFAYKSLHPAKIVTGESQAQAETPAGISLAAHNAKVGLMQDQIDQASKQIALLKNVPPSIIVKTVPVEVEKVVTQYVKTSGADFAIVTDKNDPTKVVNLGEVAKLPADTPIFLSQYNVQAFKPTLKSITVYPSFTGFSPTGIGEISIDNSRKITTDGKYIGISTAYDFDAKKVKVGLKVTF